MLVVFALLFSYGVLDNMYTYGYGFNDAFWRLVWWIDEETVWTKGFTEEKFNSIKMGMTKDEVIKILGLPLNDINDCLPGCMWVYTWHSRGNADFDQRWIGFNENDQVNEKRKSFFID